MKTSELVEQLPPEAQQLLLELTEYHPEQLLALHRHVCMLDPNDKQAQVIRYLIEREWGIRRANDKVSFFATKVEVISDDRMFED